MQIIRIEDRIEVDAASLGQSGSLGIAVHYTLPSQEQLPDRPIAFFCFPGGSLNRHYFDLDPGGANRLSFAEAMAMRGHICVMVDHPGIGASERPNDGFMLAPHPVAQIDAEVVATTRTRIEAGLPNYRPVAGMRAVGTGHSMGGMLTGLMQAHHRPFDAVAILGSHPFGAIEILMEALHHLADDPDATRDKLSDRLRELGAEPFKDMIRNPGPTSVFEEGDEAGRRAIAAIRTELLTVCGTFSMIPGSWKREAAAIGVAVLLAFGDDDLCKRPYDVPSCFTSSPDVTLHVLKDTGHNHFAFASRGRLFDRIDRWARTAVSAVPS